MTVIKEDMLRREITMRDVLPLSFLKKTPYTGSKGGLRYRMERAELPSGEAKAPAEGAEEAEGPTETVLLCSVWPEPFAFAETDPGQITKERFAFSKEGIEAAVEWLEQCRKKREEEADKES